MQKYIREIAIKNNLDEDVVNRIVRSQFEFVKEVIASGDFQPIRLHHLGLFAAKPSQVDKFMSWLGNDNNEIISPNDEEANVD